MKKFLKPILLILLFLFSLMRTFAAPYDVYDSFFTVDIPDTFITFTRDTDKSDPNVAEHSINLENLKQILGENGYVYSIGEDYKYNLLIMVSDENKNNYNYNDYTDDELMTELAGTLGSMEYQNAEVYMNAAGDKYVVLDTIKQYEEDTNIYIRAYETCYNGKIVNISMASSIEITEDMSNMQRSVIDSLNFNEPLDTEYSKPMPYAAETMATPAERNWKTNTSTIVTIILSLCGVLFSSYKNGKSKITKKKYRRNKMTSKLSSNLCSSCGKMSRSDDDFCKKCGAVLKRR